MPRYPKVNARRKPKCVGNRKVRVVQQEISAEGDCGSSESRPRPTLLQDVPKRISSSKKKIAVNLQHYQDFVGNNDIYDLIRLRTIQVLLSEVAVCKNCGSNLSITGSGRLGLSVRLELRCDSCNLCAKEMNSPVVCSGKAELNVRLAYSARCVGLGEQGGRTLCGIMNMASPAQFKYYSDVMCQATKQVSLEAMNLAAEEARK